ncbi:MAG: hypothetical protein K6F84_03695 [Lachnospiraceae bacterium]|nr:hypothetical protein [Lachnospiraceae bacterium]
MFKKSRPVDINFPIIDMHTHILWGIDDGCKSLEMALNMLKIAYLNGTRIIVATPHNMPGKGDADPEVVRTLIDRLKKEAYNNRVDVEILPGCEVYYREDCLDLLEEEKILTMNGTSLVLVEFEPMADKHYIIASLRNLISLGYEPILAHVERYARLNEKNDEGIAQIRTMGCRVQVNGDSVIGKIGHEIQKQVKRLIKKGLVDFVASDAHRDTRRNTDLKECAEYIMKNFGYDTARKLMYSNPLKYLEIERFSNEREQEG